MPHSLFRLHLSHSLIAVLCAARLSGGVTHGESPLTPEEALKSFQLADDSLLIELVAAEPLVESPCAMAFHKWLFVVENRGYPNTNNPPQGRIARLEDTDGDGRMDKRTTFADGLTFPNGVMGWGDGLIVTCAPDVLYLKDTDHDGKADIKHVLFTGFATTGSTQLRVNCPTLGRNGWIYLASGLSGGEIRAPDFPERPPLKMTSDVRFHPNTHEIENVDGRSQYGMSFDSFGRRFICMNRVPVQHVVLNSKVLARNPHLAFSETVQDCSERTVKTGLRGGGDGVRLFPISHNITTADSHAGSFSAACGIMISEEGGALGERYDDCAFTCDPTGNLVHVDRLEPRGATFAAVPMFEKGKREFLASRDDWFRPVFLTGTSDGALYICDMYRKTIEHPDYLPEEIRRRTDFESGKAMGRIWRVRRKNIEGRTSRIEHRDATAHETLMQAMALGEMHDAESTRALASLARECAGDRWMRAAILSGIAGRETEFFHQVAALVDPAELAAMLLCLREGIPADVLARALEHATGGVRDARLAHAQRATFARLLGRGDWDRSSGPLTAAASDNDDGVATAAIASLANIDAVRAAEVLLAPERWKSSRPIVRETTLGALLARGAAQPLVLAAIESGVLSASALISQHRNLFLKHKDPAIRERAEKLFGTASAGDRAKALEDAKAALALAPNGEHGREVFRTHCAICHRLEREGVAVGPDLLDMRNQPKESILFHLIVPDAEIAPAFAAYFAETKDGRALIGVLASETATSVQLRMAGGMEETLLRGNLAKLEALPNSLMPAGLEAAMSRQDLADLLAFLKGER